MHINLFLFLGKKRPRRWTAFDKPAALA